MKRPIIYSLLFSAGFPALPMTLAPAWAQVTTNEDALPSASVPRTHAAAQADALSGPAVTAAQKADIKTTQQGSAHTASAPATAPQRVGLPPDVPPTAPLPVVIVPPAVSVPTHPPVPPEEIKASQDAKSHTQHLDKGIRVVFMPGSSLMTQETIDTVAKAGKTFAGQPRLRITLWSSASGNRDDLSTPRRIALARTLAVRSILIRQGVATTRIYPRATGLANEGVTPPDRLDIIVEGSVPAPLSEAQFGVTVQKAAK